MTDNYALSNISFKSNKSLKNSGKNIKRKSKISNKSRKSSLQIFNSSKAEQDLTNLQKINEPLFCSFCGNSIIKSGLKFSCKHILCASCICREILKNGIDKMQEKIINGILNLDCPCKSGNVEITIEVLISLLYVNKDCLNHGEFKTCPKCSIWASYLSSIQRCDIHSNINSKNNSENIITDFCYDCQQGICSLCKQEHHFGHSMKNVEEIVKEIQNFKIKNKNYNEFLSFIELIENNFNKYYNNEFNLNISKLDEAIKLLNQIKNDFIEKMNLQIEYSRNIFSLLKYIYYFYYKDLATVKNNIRVIDFLFQNKYELQNISFNPKKEFSDRISIIYKSIRDLKIETFDCQLNIKSNYTYCSHTIDKAHNGYIFDIININNKYLLSAGEDKKIKIWSLFPMNLFEPIEVDSLEHNSSVFSLCKQNNGKKFFSGSYGEIKIWSSEDFNLINTLYGHSNYVSHMEIIQKKLDPFSSNALKDYLCSCSYDKTIKIWDFDILNCICTLKGHTDQINYFMQTDPGYMMSCSSDKSIKLWNIEEEKCYLSLNEVHETPIYSLARTDDGRIVSSSFSRIKIYDLNSKKYNTFFSENNKGVYKLVILPGNKLISSSFKCINFWDLNKNQWLYLIEGHNNYITCLLIYNDKLISAGDDGEIKMWE